MGWNETSQNRLSETEGCSKEQKKGTAHLDMRITCVGNLCAYKQCDHC